MAFEGEDARRWAMTDAPTLLPAVDFVTRSPNGPFLDTGINLTVESRGRVYLSVETIKEMAEIAGLLETKNAQQKSLHDKAIYDQGYEAGLKEGADLVSRLDSIRTHLASDGGCPCGGNCSSTENKQENAGAESGKSGSNSADVPATSGKRGGPRGKASSTSGSTGSDDVPSISGDSDGFKL